jgi:hypothetical protein
MRKVIAVMKIAAIFLLAVPISAQAGSAKLVGEFDLKPLGAKVPPSGDPSRTSIEILFLSDSHLVLLAENNPPGERRDTELVLYEIEKGIVRPGKMISLGIGVLPISLIGPRPERVLEWIDSEHFAYWTHLGKSGRWLCDTNLSCAEDKEEIAVGPLPHAGNCEPEDFLGYIDPQRAVCLAPGAHTKWSAVVTDPLGRRLYEVEHEAMPWDALMVKNVQGSRFGLTWESSTFFQLLDPLACLDDCPPAGKQQFVVFNSSDGRMLQRFEWDPRPYNLYALPGLSPSGETAAFVRKDKLVIYSLEMPSWLLSRGRDRQNDRRNVVLEWSPTLFRKRRDPSTSLRRMGTGLTS